MTDRAEFRRLTLQLDRDLSARVHLRVLLAVADTVIADRRQDLRNLSTRIARRPPRPGRTK